MIKYKCGHKSSGMIIADSSPPMMASYIEWQDSVGIFGTKELCWECWCKLKERRG